jgi:hypothetical protein
MGPLSNALLVCSFFLFGSQRGGSFPIALRRPEHFPRGVGRAEDDCQLVVVWIIEIRTLSLAVRLLN